MKQNAPTILLRPIDVAARGGVSGSLVRWWDTRGKLRPRFVTPDGARLYLESDVTAFLASRTRKAPRR